MNLLKMNRKKNNNIQIMYWNKISYFNQLFVSASFNA